MPMIQFELSNRANKNLLHYLADHPELSKKEAANRMLETYKSEKAKQS